MFKTKFILKVIRSDKDCVGGEGGGTLMTPAEETVGRFWCFNIQVI